MTKMLIHQQSTLRTWQWGAILLIALVPHLYKLLLPIEVLFPFFLPDDTFYYYQTALNIRNGFGSTFDTLNITNGYHPLWMLICVAVAFIATQKYLYLYLILSVNLLFVLVFSLLIAKLFARQLGFAFVTLLIFLINWQKKTSCAIFSGVETPLYLLLVAASVRYMTCISWKNAKQLFAMGILLGATFLARTSFILFAPVYLGYLAYKYLKKQPINLFAAMIVPVIPLAVMIIPYLAWNFHTIGYFQQISGLTKSLAHQGALQSTALLTTTLGRLAESFPLILQPQVFTGGILLLIGFFFYIIYIKKIPLTFLDSFLVMFLFFSLLELAYYFIYYGAIIRIWHLALLLINIQILFVFMAKYCWDYYKQQKVVRRFLQVTLVAIVLGYAIQIPYYSRVYYTVYPAHKAAAWIRQHLPQNVTIGVWDAGIVGYFSERKVVNLDGLINGKELYENRKKGDSVFRYIIDKKIDYVGNWFLGQPYILKSEIAPALEPVFQTEENFMNDKKTTSYAWYLWKLNYDKLK